ncbi:MAG: DUF4097 family beta strand repeat-containing protein [Sedimentisphaerales bacterium]|nr:DUF4097 family beta strand repeat-containing protein [Sedimentisphaerales bacterium]
MKYGYFTKKSLLICLLGMLTISACSCVNIGDLWPRVEYKETNKFDASLAPGSILALENEVGSITIDGQDVTNCDVTAAITVKAPTEEEAKELARQIKIELEQNGDTLTVKTTKPRQKRRRSISINFKIVVPKQTALQISSNVGEIHVSNITEDIKAQTDVGKISCKEISGDIDLKVDVGKVNVVYSKTASAACNVTIRTDVGSIDITTPPECSAAVQANTDVGSISTDMPLTIKGRVGKNLQGTIGAGEGKLSLMTDVGSIRIR